MRSDRSKEPGELVAEGKKVECPLTVVSTSFRNGALLRK